MHIRQMLPEDLPEVISIDQNSFSQPWPEEAFEIELQNPNARCWVAETATLDGQKKHITAILVIWRVLDEAHIATIAVAEDYRGQGVGKLILQKGMHEAYKEGARLFYLEVRAGNIAAKKMYFYFGYEIVGIRPKYYKNNGEDALLMTLDLNAKKHAEFLIGETL